MDVDKPPGFIDFEDLAGDEGDVNNAAYHPETARLLSELDRRKLAGKLAVPTNDNSVRHRLREAGQPITLFGERREDRRERLRDLLSRIAAERGDGEYAIGSDSGSDDEQNEEFYTPGTDALLAARRQIATTSLANARKRIERQRLEASLTLGKLLDFRKSIYSELRVRGRSLRVMLTAQTYATLGSQIGDDRPLGIVRFAPNSGLLATGSWNGTAKIWDVPSLRCRAVFKGPCRDPACALTH